MKDTESTVEREGAQLANLLRDVRTAWVRQHPTIKPDILQQTLIAGAILYFVDTIAGVVETHPQRESLIHTILSQLPEGIQASLEDLKNEEHAHG